MPSAPLRFRARRSSYVQPVTPAACQANIVLRCDVAENRERRFSMSNAGLPYRPNVGIVVFNGEGLALVGERLDNPGAWQYPQGGVDSGEAFEAAAKRELYEETGIAVDTFVAQTTDFLYYDFPPDLVIPGLTNRYAGQKQRWYLAFWNQAAESANLTTHTQEFARVRFMPMAEATNQIVPFKRDIYAALEREFLPVMHNYLQNI